MSITLEHGVAGLISRDAIDGKGREEMFALLSQHFEGVKFEQFERDLEEKNWVVEVRREGKLLGFSTLLVCDVEFDGRILKVIYSGDTIVAPEAWNSSALPRSWIAAVKALRARSPAYPCYWLLLTSGFRTYRFLPVFWREFYPRYDAPTSERSHRILDHLARQNYGDSYNAESGIVRFSHPQRLRGSLRAIPSGRMGNLHIAFFLARNPGHAHGDELACITEISDENLTAAGRRMVSCVTP